MTLKNAPEAVRDGPPSAKLVWKILEEEGQLTQAEIVEHTLLDERTARHALEFLRGAGVIEVEPNPEDARQSLYVTE